MMSLIRSIGALVFQMPIDRINDIMTARAGDQETEETYLVGKDKLMRSASRFEGKASILATKVDTEAVRQALQGETGSGRISDYRGREVLSAETAARLREHPPAALVQDQGRGGKYHQQAGKLRKAKQHFLVISWIMF